MPLTQFQDEPYGTMSLPCRRQDIVGNRKPRAVSNGAMASLLLGLSLRGRLTETERAFLDDLAPPQCIIFLVRNKRYLHPDNVELFPLDLIDAASNQCDAAIFSHRYSPSADGTGRTYEIQTAVLNPADPEPLILGFFGPESSLEQQVCQECFGNVVASSCRIHRSLGDFVVRTRRSLSTETPTLVVNRASGRIMCLNKAASQLFDEDRLKLVDREFGEARQYLAGALEGRKLIMQNVSEGDLSLTLVAFPPAAVSVRNDDSLVADFFVGQMRQKVSNIMIAASLLESTAGDTGEDKVALAGTIVKETEELDNHLARLNLLVDYDHLVTIPTSLLTAMEHAVDLVAASVGSACSIVIRDRVGGLTVDVPRCALVSLFESILLTHLAGGISDSQTIIVAANGEAEGDICVSVETRLDQSQSEPEIAPYWSDYARRLADRMSLGKPQSRVIKGLGIKTEITINPNLPGAKK